VLIILIRCDPVIIKVTLLLIVINLLRMENHILLTLLTPISANTHQSETRLEGWRYGGMEGGMEGGRYGERYGGKEVWREGGR